MSTPASNRDSKSPRAASASTDRVGKAASAPVTAADYFSLATFLQRREQLQRGAKREPQSEAIRAAGEQYEHREYAAAFDSFKPVYDRVVTDMQRVLARNVEIEAKKMATQQGKSLTAAKENVLQMRAHAQQLADQFEKLRQDLEHKPLVRLHIKKRNAAPADAPNVEEASPITVNSANETHVGAAPIATEPIITEPPSTDSILVGNDRYKKVPYAPPRVGSLYSVRDKSQSERIISVIAVNAEVTVVQVDVLDQGAPRKQPLELAVESLARQAAKGLCHLLVSVATLAQESSNRLPPGTTNDGRTMRIDIQNFGRCCGAIALASIKFNTQGIKDVADGSFRAGEYEKAFLTFEQLVIGFSSAVNLARQEIADGRRALLADKGRLSGKEVQERTALLVRREQRVFAAEREFSTILEGLRMYLLVKQ